MNIVDVIVDEFKASIQSATPLTWINEILSGPDKMIHQAGTHIFGQGKISTFLSEYH